MDGTSQLLRNRGAATFFLVEQFAATDGPRNINASLHSKSFDHQPGNCPAGILLLSRN
jgi:hypothetical protein